MTKITKIIGDFINYIRYNSDRILIVENESRSVKHIVKDLEAKIEKLEHEINMLENLINIKPRHVNPDELVDDFI